MTNGELSGLVKQVIQSIAPFAEVMGLITSGESLIVVSSQKAIAILRELRKPNVASVIIGTGAHKHLFAVLKKWCHQNTGIIPEYHLTIEKYGLHDIS